MDAGCRAAEEVEELRVIINRLMAESVVPMRVKMDVKIGVKIALKKSAIG